MQTLIKQGHNVYAAVPAGDYIQKLVDIGCHIIDTPIERRGINPIKEIQLILKYKKILEQIGPDTVLTYTIKPNIYGGFVCRMKKLPQIANITGIGTAIENKRLLKRLALILYRIAIKSAQTVFFQNQSNLELFLQEGIVKNNFKLLPGSGVDLNEHIPQLYPKDDIVEFVFVGRLMKEKGIEDYFTAAVKIREEYPNTRFHICGRCEDRYEKQLEILQSEDVVIFHQYVGDMKEIYAKIHCTIHPSYYGEGMSNVILESAASARPVITTDNPGCCDAVEDGVSGFIYPKGNVDALIKKIRQFLALSWEQKRDMGLAGRRLVEQKFDRQVVVDAYMREIEANSHRVCHISFSS